MKLFQAETFKNPAPGPTAARFLVEVLTTIPLAVPVTIRRAVAIAIAVAVPCSGFEAIEHDT